MACISPVWLLYNLSACLSVHLLIPPGTSLEENECPSHTACFSSSLQCIYLSQQQAWGLMLSEHSGPLWPEPEHIQTGLNPAWGETAKTWLKQSGPLLYIVSKIIWLLLPVCVSLPGSVGAAGRPPSTLHCFVLVGTISAVVTFATQREFQRIVETKRTVLLQGAQVHLCRSHLGWKQTVSLCQQLIGWDVDKQLIGANPAVQQDPPDEVWGVWPRIQGPTSRDWDGSAA